MEIINFLIDFVLHIDKHLYEIFSQYQTWTYLILFLIVFCETGLVVTPFLPGDSLLFASGALAAMPGEPLNIYLILAVFFSAAIIGDNTNYFIGKFLGTRVYEKNYRLINRKYLEKTHTFYEKHGGKTIIMARFMPFLRTFAPFVAGVGTMHYPKFFTFSLAGNILWVNIFCWAGFLFAENDFVKNNFSVVIIGIILVSIIPPVVAVIRSKLKKS